MVMMMMMSVQDRIRICRGVNGDACIYACTMVFTVNKEPLGNSLPLHPSFSKKPMWKYTQTKSGTMLPPPPRILIFAARGEGGGEGMGGG